MMTFTKAFDILKGKKLAQKPIQAAWICHLAQEKIDKLFPEKDILVFSYRNKTINIKVPNSALAGEVRMRAEDLKNYLNQKLKKNLVENIRTKIA